MSIKVALTLMFGIVTIIAWYLSATIGLRRSGPGVTKSRPLVFIFTGVVTVAELILIASLIFGRNS